MWDLIVSVPEHCLSFYFAFTFVKGGTSSFLFILKSLLIKLDLVVYLLRYYFIKVLKVLKPFLI